MTGVVGLWGHSVPQLRPTVAVGAYLPFATLRVTPRRAAGSAAHSVGQVLTQPKCDNCACPRSRRLSRGLRLHPARISLVCRRSTGAVRPQCRPRAHCDGAYRLNPSLLGNGAGRPQCWLRPTVPAVPASDPYTLTHGKCVVSQSVGRRLGCAAGLVNLKACVTPTWTRALGAEFSKPPDLLPALGLTRSVLDF